MLGDYFRDKIAYLKEFLAATRSLEAALDRNDLDEAAVLLQKRHDLAAAVDKIDKQLGMIGSHKSAAINKLNKYNIEIIKSSVEINERCCKKIAAARNDTGLNIKGLRRHKSGIDSYRKVARGICEPRFLTSEF
jgi:hypothetical protein